MTLDLPTLRLLADHFFHCGVTTGTLYCADVSEFLREFPWTLMADMALSIVTVILSQSTSNGNSKRTSTVPLKQ